MHTYYREYNYPPQKIQKKMKAGSCEICDEKFEDEDAHVASARHQSFLTKKRKQFDQLFKQCDFMFPDGINGFLSRLDEFNASPVPSPMPIR